MSGSLTTPILVTGATGFIGSNLVRYLLSDYKEIHIIIRNQSNLWRINDIIDKMNVHIVDLIDRVAVEKVIEKIKPRTVFHLAAYGAYPFQYNKRKIISVNLDGTINLVDACLNHNFDILINTGSNSEYGFKNSPMKETDILCPNSQYAVMKAAATNYCNFIGKSENRPIMTVRPFHIYGPYEEQSRFIPKLLTKLFDNELPNLVSPDIARDMLYIDDAVDLFITIATNEPIIGDIYNMGSGKQSTIKSIVDVALSLTNSNVTPKWDSMEPRMWDQNTWVADMTKVKEIFDWEPRYSLKDGLTKTINWYKNSLKLDL